MAILVPRFPTDFKIKAPGDPTAGQSIVGSGIEDRERGSPGDIKREQENFASPRDAGAASRGKSTTIVVLRCETLINP